MAKLTTLGETDDSADPVARHKKITVVVIARFLNCGVDWVQDCCRCQSLLNQYSKEPAVKALIKKLENESLGVKNLLTQLREAVGRDADEDEMDVDMDYDEGPGRPSYIEIASDSE